MSSVINSVFFFILTLGVLITFHEFGHYWVARKLGVKVLRFSVGFGHALWKTQRGSDQTEYVIAALPLGGYVKMLDEREGEVSQDEVHRAFNRQTLLTRTLIVAAGPAFNFILAIFIYWLVFMAGVTGVRPIIGEVSQGSIAAMGGFQQGDQFMSIAGKETPTWEVTILALLDAGLSTDSVTVTVQDADKLEVDRQLNVSTLAGDLEQGNIMELLGFQPARLEVPAVIGHLEPSEPASQAGLQAGDRIISADGKSIAHWGELVEIIRAKPELDLAIDIKRDGQLMSLVLRPKRVSSREGDYGRIGAGVEQREDLMGEFIFTQRFGPIDALGQSLDKTWSITVLTFRMLYKMVVGDVSVSNLSGPLSIAQYAGGSASIGLISFLTFLAIVSISLGVLNILPVPMLDGGHLMYYAVEWIKGSPVSEQTEALGQRIGIFLILGLMVFAFYNDLTRIFS